MKKTLAIVVLSLVSAVCCALFIVGCATKNTVSFEIGITGYDGDGVSSQTVNTGEAFTFPEAPTVTDYEFQYWSDGDATYDAGSTYTVATDGDLKFTAVYTPYITVNYSVTVESLAGDEISTPASVRVLSGTEITLPELSDDHSYVWNINGLSYNGGAKYTPTSATPATITASATATRSYVYVSYAVAEGSEKYYDGVTLPATARVGVGSNYTVETVTPAYTVDAKYYTVSSLVNGEAKTEFSPAGDITVYLSCTYIGMGDDGFEFIAVKNEEDETVAYTVAAGADIADYAEDGAIYLPATHDGLPVTGIYAGTSTDNAFGGANITSVYIPDCYKSVAAYAFYNNTNLQKVILASEITGIGTYAFYGNTALTSVIYEENSKLETIGNYAFSGDTAITTISASETLTGLRFPAEVTSIGNYAFYGVSIGNRVVNVYFDTENGKLETIGAYAFAATGATAVKRGGITLQTAFPSTLKEVGSYAFYMQPMGKIDFGENATITTIGDYAFCSNANSYVLSTVTELVIPASVTSIGIHAFQKHRIEYLEFEEGSKITEISEYAFDLLSSLNTLILPENLTLIGENAFSNSFASGFDLVIPSAVTTISASAFKTSNVGNLVIPASVTSIGASAFASANISSITFSPVAAGETAQALTIGSKAFNTAKAGAMAVTIPNRVSSIAERAFYQLNITSLTFEDGGDIGLTLEDYAFNAESTSTSKGISTTSTSTSFYPFTATEITLPARLVSMGTGAFQGQTNLQHVYYAEGFRLDAIPDYAFSFCINLREINLPDTVETIGQHAYTQNTFNAKVITYENGTATTVTGTANTIYNDIASVTFPASVTTIKANAFYNRFVNLSSMTFNGTADSADLTIEKNAFSILNTYSGGKSNTALTGITFPANLVSIGGAFINSSTVTGYNCYTNLANFDFSNCARLTTLGSYFGAYSPITSFTVPSTVTTIDSYVFYASKLETLSFGDSRVESIGTYAFANAQVANGSVTSGFDTVALTGTITLPDSVTSIGVSVFAGVGISAIEINSATYRSTDGVVYSYVTDASDNEVITLALYPYGKTDTSYKVIEGCTVIGDSAVKGAKFETIDLNGVTTVNGTNAFANSNLKSVNFDLVSIGNYAFYNCTSLGTAYINITGGTVPTYLFAQCSNLTTVTLGENITQVTSNMFISCKALTSVTFNGTITSIAANGFSTCTSLKSITLDNTTMVTLVNKTAFASDSMTVNVPATLVGAYQADSIWAGAISAGTVTIAGIPGAYIGSAHYETLEEAIEAASDEGQTTITLYKDFEAVEIVAAKNIVIDLNGFTISGKTVEGEGYYDSVYGAVTVNDAGAQVTIKNGTLTAAGVWSSPNLAATLYIMSGKVTLENVTVEATDESEASAAIAVYGELVITSADVTSNGYGIGVFASAKLTVEQATVTTAGNPVSTNAAISSADMAVVINGGAFECTKVSDLSTDWAYAAIYWASHGKLTINGGTFTTGVTTSTPLYVKNGTVEINGGTFNTELEATLVAEGYEVQINRTGTFEVGVTYYVKGAYVAAEIEEFDANTTYYTYDAENDKYVAVAADAEFDGTQTYYVYNADKYVEYDGEYDVEETYYTAKPVYVAAEITAFEEGVTYYTYDAENGEYVAVAAEAAFDENATYYVDGVEYEVYENVETTYSVIKTVTDEGTTDEGTTDEGTTDAGDGE